MTHPSRGPSLIGAGRQLPSLAKSRIGRAAIWAVIAAFVSVVIGGWSFSHHLQAVGLVFAVVAGLSLVALFGIGLIAAVTVVPRMARPPANAALPPGWTPAPQSDPLAAAQSYGQPPQPEGQQPYGQPAQPEGQQPDSQRPDHPPS
jgi:hypothetical protein